MTYALCAVVLAAGEGTRLRPITHVLPKALCPVGNVALLDRALARLDRHGLRGPVSVAVNAWHLADHVVAHVGARAYLSVESGPSPLGTAGAIANLRDWIAGRAVLVANADAYLAPRTQTSQDLAALLRDWDGTTVRILCVDADDRHPPEFSGRRFAGFSLLPAQVAAELPLERSELVTSVWRPAERAGLLELVPYDGLYLDTGTPADYLAANLHAAGASSLVAPDALVTGEVERSVIGPRARVEGRVTRTVVLPDAVVGPDEHLVDAVRLGADITMWAAGADRRHGRVGA